jgi:hypothetical protein
MPTIDAAGEDRDAIIIEEPQTGKQSESVTADAQRAEGPPERPKEIGGRDGPDPTRFGDWEKGGRCIDF